MVARKPDSEVPACGCSFTIDENGLPVVECPDAETQALAFHALSEHPDVSVRVVPALEPEADEELDPGEADDDLDLGEADTFDGEEHDDES